MLIITPLFISSTEIVFIMFIVVMIFGADKIPDIAKGLGKGIRTLKNATTDIKGEIKRSAKSDGIETDISQEVTDEINKVKNEVNDLADSVRRK